MPYQLTFDQEVKKIIQHLPPLRKKQMRESLHCLAQDPLVGKELQEELTGLMSLRVGTYRTIYKLDHEKMTLHIIAIGPRSSIYEELMKSHSRPSQLVKPREP